MTQPARMIGHMAFYYRPGDGPLAARFFEALGCTVLNFGSISAWNAAAGADDSCVYKVLLDPAAPGPEQYFYISPVRAELLAFDERLSELLSQAEEPRFAAFQAFKAEEPEMFFHQALRYDSLDDLEAAVLRIEYLSRSCSEMEGRISLLRFRPRSDADPQVNARIAASAVFKPDDRRAFGDRSVQLFVHTDLYTGELLIPQTLELGYTFPQVA